jgi:hypothetical protein
MNPLLISTAYLPPVSWMAVVIQSHRTGIEIYETYPKQTFRNRCIIATSAGKLSLSVPVMKINGNHTKTGEILIDNSKKWQQLHWRSIVTAYNKSPYFLYYRDLFEPVYKKDFELLVDLNTELCAILLKELNVSTAKLYSTSEYQSGGGFRDLRNSFSPKENLHQAITTNLPRYIQVFEENTGFVPDLSIIDLLFNLGPETLPYLSRIKLQLQELPAKQKDIRP